MRNYISIHCSEEEYKTKWSLLKMLEVLPPEDFIQIHKSYIIRWDMITSISKGFSHCRVAGKWLPIGNNYIQSLKKRTLLIG